MSGSLAQRSVAQRSVARQAAPECCRYLLLVVVAHLLVACAGQPSTDIPTDADWAQHSARMRALDNWTAEGKLALRTSQKSESASLLWQQQGRFTEVHLSGPVGLNATTIISDGQRLEIRQGDDVSSLDISDPEALARETGWDLPLQSLPHWLRGLPAPDSEASALELDPERILLVTLRQDGWEVHYEEYANFGDFTLPTRLRIRGQDVSARVIIRNWQIPGVR